MGSVPRDDNFVPGLLVKGSTTGADVVVEGDETTKGINVQLAGSDVDIPITLDGEVVTITNDDTVSTNNSTTSVLAGDAVFTGTGDDCLGYSSITIQLDSSHDSATDGMTFQFSIDNSNWDESHLFTYTAANGARTFQLPIHARYFRIVYTNGNVLQTHFRVQTILHRQNSMTTIHRLSDDENPDRSAQMVKAVIVARSAGTGDFKALNATAGANLKVSVEEYDTSAALDYLSNYQAAAATDVVVKAAAGTLHAIAVGDSVANATIEVSDHASDGDGNVKIFLSGDTIGPAVYPVNMRMSTGITADIVNQTKVTFIYK
jgi:hypothetical protein